MFSKDPTNSEILKVVSKNSKDVELMQKDINNLKLDVSSIKRTLYKHDERLTTIEEHTAYLPKLYDAVDKFMVEILASRQEREFINSRLDDHGERLVKLETSFAL